MIVFDLRCDGAHVFEAWFASSHAFAEQCERRLIACPICGSSVVEKAVMAPNVAVGRPCTVDATPSPGTLIAQIAAAQAAALKQSRWVGRGFAAEARAMHEGERPHAIIHGEATPAEARALHDDGIAALPLLVPVVPPGQTN